jgi:predicted metalloprotease
MTIRRALTTLLAFAALAVTPAAAAAAPSDIARAGAVRIKLSADRPVTPELFGQVNTYASSRNLLIQWVNYTFASHFPASFREPGVYEVRDAAVVCGTRVYNAVYCPSRNLIAYSRKYAKYLYARIGDAGFAALIAHEYGHGVQQWLGYRSGRFRYELTGESFADCMAGGFMAQMSNWGYVDSLGYGDYREMLAAFRALSDRYTSTDGSGHGDAAWRTAKVNYGWSNGTRGCAEWGHQLNLGQG